MGKFRKRSIIIEAVQWFAGQKLPTGCFYRHGKNFDLACCFIETLEGVMRIDSGDWVVTGVKGEKYPVKPDIFEATYDPVEPEVERMQSDSNITKFPGESAWDAIVAHAGFDIEEEAEFLTYCKSEGVEQDSDLETLQQAYQNWLLVLAE